MPPASSGIKNLVLSAAFLGERCASALACSAAPASHFLQEAQGQLLQHKHPCSTNDAQLTPSQHPSSSLARLQCPRTWCRMQALHNQRRHELLANAAVPSNHPAPSVQSSYTASSGSAMLQQHPAYQQQLYLETGPYQGHHVLRQGQQVPLQLQPKHLPQQQQLMHHQHLLDHQQHKQYHSWPYLQQHVHYYHVVSNHKQLHASHYHDMLTQVQQQQQQQQQQRRGMATRSIPFVDRVRMVVEGGKGGNGCVSYAQVARGRRQAATGGNGGDGGSVVLRASRAARELRGLPRVVRGGPGGHGRPNGRTGAHGDTRVVDVPVGMVVSLLEDVPLAEAEQSTRNTRTMEFGNAKDLGTTTDQSSWTASSINHQDNLSGSSNTSSLRQPLHRAQDPSSTNTDSSAQRASLQSSPAGQDAVLQAGVESSSPPGRDSWAGESRWASKEQGEAPRHQRNSTKNREHNDHRVVEKAREGRRQGEGGTGCSLGPQAAHLQHNGVMAGGAPVWEGGRKGEDTDSKEEGCGNDGDDVEMEGVQKQEGVMAGGGPVWGREGEDDSEDEEYENDVDDVEVEEDEEEEDEEYEEGVGWEGDGNAEGEDDAEREKPPQRLRVLAELLELGQQITVAVGGHGGSGNASTHSPSRSRFRPPSAREPSSEFTQGSMGSSATLVLELKMLADVGLVGMPNAGKSSLLKALTGARAKVGSYAFTTLHPQLGTIVGSHEPPSEQSSRSNSNGRKGSSGGARSRQHAAADGNFEYRHQTSERQSLVLADIPGLISGAHEDRGRGNLFLRHVERVGCIAYVIDLSGGQTEANALVALTPAEQLAVLQDELQAYIACRQDVPLSAFHGTSASDGTQAVPAMTEQGSEESPAQAVELVIANKVDACVRPQQALAELKESTHLPIIPVSALHAAGLERLASALQTAVHSARSRC